MGSADGQIPVLEGLIPSMPPLQIPLMLPTPPAQSPSPPIEGETCRGGVVPSTNITLQPARNLPPLAAFQGHPSGPKTLLGGRGWAPPTSDFQSFVVAIPISKADPLDAHPFKAHSCSPLHQRKARLPLSRGRPVWGCRTIHQNHATTCPQPAFPARGLRGCELLTSPAFPAFHSCT